MPAIDVNNIAKFISEVALFINLSAKVVQQFALATVFGLNETILVFIKLAHHILNVETLAIIVKELVEVIIVELALVKFLSSIFVNNVALVRNAEPAVLIDASSFLINEEALASLHKNRLSIRIVKVAHNMVGVEIVLLNTEGCWDFSTLIHVIMGEHGLASHILNDIVCLWVSQVTSWVDWLALFVVLTPILIFQNNNITFVVSVQVS